MDQRLFNSSPRGERADVRTDMRPCDAHSPAEENSPRPVSARLPLTGTPARGSRHWVGVYSVFPWQFVTVACDVRTCDMFAIWRLMVMIRNPCSASL